MTFKGKFPWIAIACVVAALTIQSCGSDKKDEDTSTDTGSTDFTKDIKPITDKACASSGCHDTKQGSVEANVFTDGTKFKASGSLAAINSGSMPPDASTWTAAEKAKVVAYLGGK